MSQEKIKNDHNLAEGWAFSKKNYLIFFSGLALIILGYLVMYLGDVNSFQALSVAPVMLFIGYIVIIPIALIYRDKKKNLGS